METKVRRIRVSIFILFTLTSSSLAMERGKTIVPDFKAKDCIEFRRRLSNHTLLSFYDRRHSTRLGIAGVSLFWTGLPGIPLGIAAAWTGKRQETAAIQEMLISGVRKENFQEVNRLCAILLKASPVEDANFDGRNQTALILGAVATAFSTFVLIVQVCYGTFFFWNLDSHEDHEEEEFLESIEDLVSKKVAKRRDGRASMEDPGEVEIEEVLDGLTEETPVEPNARV